MITPPQIHLNFVSLIKIDLAGSIGPDFGISQDQLSAVAPTVDRLRDDFLAEVQSSENHFFDLPMQQYKAYQAQREASPLGRVFDVGTGLNDHIDAVVVVGSAEVTAAARGIFRSCCDPYHNELSRADRGSRPRMYFAGDTFDNDDLAALLHRLSQRDFRDSPAESRWALLVMDSPDEESGKLNEESRLAYKILLRELFDPKRFLFSVVIPGGWLDHQTKSLDCENVFEIPAGSGTAEQSLYGRTLSALSLLPSAMLGLDCIKLLEGAVMMNEHFKSSSLEENVVLQFVAIHHLLANDGIAGRCFQAWPSSLDWLPGWYQSLRPRGNNRATIDSAVITNWVAQNPRYDLVELGDESLVDKMTASIRSTNQADRLAREPTLSIELPTIDTRVLGQIFQMLLIATKIEAQLKESSALPSSV